MQCHKYGNVLDSGYSWEQSVCSHLEQILKKYPDYEPNEYILWIESALICPVQHRAASAQIILRDEYGNEITKLLLTRDFKIGKPYPNPSFSQMRLKNGRGSVFGIPLRFKTSDELKQIKHIDIMWNLEFWLQNETYNSLTTLSYDLDFVPDEHKRFYTIVEYAICNIICGWKVESDLEHYQKWLKQFDNAQTYAFKMNQTLSDEEIHIVNENCVVFTYHPEASYLITHTSTKASLEPTDFSSIWDERSYGFKRINENQYCDYQKFIDYHNEYYKHKLCRKE